MVREHLDKPTYQELLDAMGVASNELTAIASEMGQDGWNGVSQARHERICNVRDRLATLLLHHVLGR